MKNIGFIGMGNMAQALAIGFLSSGKSCGEEIYAFAPNQEKLNKNAEKIGFKPCAEAAEAIKNAELVILACKPYQIEGVLKENREALKGKLIVSVAYGWTLEKALPHLPENARYQYMVPNTPVSVCCGVLLVEEENSLETKDEEWLVDLFGSVGTYMKLPTHLIGAANACGTYTPM